MGNRVTVDERILVSAVRYALGRQTYIVGWTVDEVIRVWPKLTTAVRELIIREVIDAVVVVDASPRISDIDRPEWDRILLLEVTA